MSSSVALLGVKNEIISLLPSGRITSAKLYGKGPYLIELTVVNQGVSYSFSVDSSGNLSGTLPRGYEPRILAALNKLKLNAR